MQRKIEKSVEREGFCEQGGGRRFFVGLCIEKDVLCGDETRACKPANFCYVRSVNR